MKELVTDLARVGRFSPMAPYQRFGYVCGALLVLSGLIHGAVYLVAGGPWEGPISWRKPIVFGLSFGITLVTLTWILGFMRLRRTTGWVVLTMLAIASTAEVLLISMQKWRGVESHFNERTTFDAMVFSAMGMLVAVVAGVTVLLTVWSLTRLDAPAGLAFAIRAGLVLMLVSQMVGVQMIVNGGNTFGAAGVLKVPHAFTLHAVQVLPALALVLLLWDPVERHRVRTVALGTAGYAALIASTMVQTYAGRSPFDVGIVSTALAFGGLALLAASALIALRGLASRLHSPTSPSALGT